MKDEFATAAVNSRVLQELRLQSSAATLLTPSDPEIETSSGSVYVGTESPWLHTGINAWAAAEAKMAAMRAHQSPKAHNRSWKGHATWCGIGTLLLTTHHGVAAESFGIEPPSHMYMTSMVARHEMQADVWPSGYCLRDSPAPWIGAFTHDAEHVIVDTDPPTTFNVIEPVEQYEARALRLFAELQNGASLGRASAKRLRELLEAAREEGESFSLDALEALVAFANAYPKMPKPELTITAEGGILAEWRRPQVSVVLYFVSVSAVQYLVKRENPRHPALVERGSGTTSIDLVGDRIQALVSPLAWPIPA